MKHGWADVRLEPRFQELLAGWATVPSVDVRDMSADEFERRWWSKKEPLCLEGAMDSWPAWTSSSSSWSPEGLASRWGDEVFECGEDREERAVLLDLEDFLDYAAEQRDDSPLYLFDGTFDVGAGDLLDLYSPPHVFRWDLLSQWGEEGERPPFRWFLLGPTRSGSNPHVDPLGTSAWNALLAGRKLWVFFPPETDPSNILVDSDTETEGVKPEPSAWFMTQLPRIASCSQFAAAGARYRFQDPGQVMAVPSGWWHAVLNVSDALTVAVTQNFACPMYIDQTVEAVRTETPGVGWETWLARVQELRRDDGI